MLCKQWPYTKLVPNGTSHDDCSGLPVLLYLDHVTSKNHVPRSDRCWLNRERTWLKRLIYFCFLFGAKNVTIITRDQGSLKVHLFAPEEQSPCFWNNEYWFGCPNYPSSLLHFSPASLNKWYHLESSLVPHPCNFSLKSLIVLNFFILFYLQVQWHWKLSRYFYCYHYYFIITIKILWKVTNNYKIILFLFVNFDLHFSACPFVASE